MHRVLFLLVMVALTACHQNKSLPAEQENVAVAAPSEKVKPLTEEDDSLPEPHHDIAWDQIEVFHFSQALINNKVPLFTNRQRFETALGVADSVRSTENEDICGSQFDEDFSYFYKDGSTFELCKDSIACEEFILTADHFVTCDKITFNRNTTWEDMKKLFPKAVRQAENEGKTDMLTLRDSDSLESASSVQLYFENGKLVRIVNFIPC